MKIMIDIDKNLYTRILDNGSETDEQGRKAIETAIRKGTLLSEYCIDSIIPYLLHSILGCPLNECVNAYEKAIDYLRSKANMKG